MMFNKKGQEEIVGFVLIVVLVAIVFVVLLAIFLRSPKTPVESMETAEFLESLSKYTSSCAIGYEPRYSSLGDLFGDCYSGSSCVSGKSACETLNSTLNEVITSSFGIAPGSYYTGYRLDAYYNSTSDQKEIISLSSGNCSSYKGGDYFFSHQGGTIDVLLKLCVSA